MNHTDWMVTRLAWMAQRLVSSKSETRYDSTDSWSAPMAEDWNRRSDLKSWAISRTLRQRVRWNELVDVTRQRVAGCNAVGESME